MTDVYNNDFDGLVSKISGYRWAGSTIKVNVDGLLDNPSQHKAAMDALKVWSTTTGLKFEYVHDNSAQIDFSNDYGGAFTYHYENWSDHTVYKTMVNVSSNWQTWAPEGTDPWQKGYYGFQTFLHEIGHALGLEHAGNYNGGSPDYFTDALYLSDTFQYSAMSYFWQSNQPYNYASNHFLTGPMIADIEAIRQLYGPLAVNEGNTVYGAGETVLDGWTDFGKHPNVSYCIHDTGGHDLLDFSNVTDGRPIGWYSYGNIIDLRPGYFSDIGGYVGNVSIARDTVIEDARGSQLSDIIRGNDADNALYGLDGNDSLFGGNGKDRLVGGNGDDYLEGNEGNDTMEGGEGFDTLYGGDGNDVLNGGAGDDYMEGGSGADDYYVDSAGDQVIDIDDGSTGNDDMVRKASDWISYNKVKSPAQSDRVTASISYMLGDGIENLNLAGNDRINGTGNGLNNWMKGNGADNVLSGLQGSDKLWGGGGNDMLDGGSGDDWLDGGYGKDILTGGTGNDAFVFGAGFSKAANGLVSRGSLNASSDIVRDFVKGEDIIALSRTSFSALNSGDKLNQSGFLLWGKGVYSTLSRIIYDDAAGKLFYDADGSGRGYEKVLIASFDTKPSLDVNDFMLIA